MNRLSKLVLAFTFAVAATGCKSSVDRPEATVAQGGMMPGGESAPLVVYALDQGEVKVVPARTISYEPLDTFRAKLDADRAERTKASATANMTKEPTGGDGQGGGERSGNNSIWGSFKSLLNQASGKSDDAGMKSTDAPKAADSSPKPDDSSDDENADDEAGKEPEEEGSDGDW